MTEPGNKWIIFTSQVSLIPVLFYSTILLIFHGVSRWNNFMQIVIDGKCHSLFRCANAVVIICKINSWKLVPAERLSIFYSESGNRFSATWCGTLTIIGKIRTFSGTFYNLLEPNPLSWNWDTCYWFFSVQTLKKRLTLYFQWWYSEE